VKASGVREEEELLARAAELVERLREVVSALDVARRSFSTTVRIVPSRCASSMPLADVHEEARVVEDEALLLERLDDARVESCLAERVQRVDPVVARRGGADLLLLVERRGSRPC